MRIEFRVAYATQLIAAVTIAGAALVLAGAHTIAGRLGVLTGLAVALIWRPPILVRRSPEPMRRRASAAIVALVASVIAALLVLSVSGTATPIRSPWSVVPSAFGVLVVIGAAATAILALRNEAIARVGVTATLLLGSAVAILTYRLGFGFDHFIHVAAERIILEHGHLSPIPIFYSGYYGIVTLLATIPGISGDLADRLIVPLVAVTLLPTLLAIALERPYRMRRAEILGGLALLIVPSLPFAVSTPQALANTFALATLLMVIINVPEPETGRWRFRWIRGPVVTALAALVSQPMSGVLAFATIAVAWCLAHRQRVAATIAGTAGVLSLPVAFALAPLAAPAIDVRVHLAIGSAVQRLAAAIADAVLFTARDFASADALAIARVVLPIIWIVLAIKGRRALRDAMPRNAPGIAAGTTGLLTVTPLIALGAAVAVAATVTVPTQLTEEQSHFPIRLVQLAALLALPLAASGLGAILDRVRTGTPRAAAALLVGVAGAFTLHLAYPRDDAQARSGLWSVSASDIAAVHAISADAGDARYVVLANQMLGAAAIREFGFRPAHRIAGAECGMRNVECEILAFPLPAGGPIAQRFWEYVTQPVSPVSTIVEIGDTRNLARKPIDAAMNLVGADRAYVVLHDYWRNAERLAAATATIADAELTPIPHLRIFRLARE